MVLHSENVRFHNIGKQIDMPLVYIRDHVQKDDIVIPCVSTQLLADVLTRGRPKEKHAYLTDMLGMTQTIFGVGPLESNGFLLMSVGGNA